MEKRILIITGIVGLVISIPFILSPFLEYPPPEVPTKPEEPQPTDEPEDTEPTVGYAIIKGKVTDAETGEPIASVTITADTEYETTTGSKEGKYWGIYYLKVELGSYLVKASKLGYSTESDFVHAYEEKVYECNFVLTPEGFILVIETVDEKGNRVNGEIFLNGKSVGKGYVELSVKTNEVYTVSYGDLTGYVTPETENFYIPAGTTRYEVKGVYLSVKRPADHIKLTVYVKVYSLTLKTEFALEGATVTIPALELEAITDDNGMVFFWIPKNYGDVTIKAYHEAYGETSKKVTIGAEDIETKIRFYTGGLIIYPMPLHMIPLSLAPAISPIGHVFIGIFIATVSIVLIWAGMKKE